MSETGANMTPRTMQQTPHKEEEPKPVQSRLLIPLTTVLILLVFGVEALLTIQYRDHQRRTNKVLLSTAVRDLDTALQEQTTMLEAVQDAILHDESLKHAPAAGDRDRLLAEWQPLYEKLRQAYGITHFYFHGPDRVNLLRMHKPEKYGDLIGRFTAREAERTGKTVSGVELGPLGTLTLRVVRPVFDGKTLVGYLELGKEIGDVLSAIDPEHQIDVAVTIYKNSLERKRWESGMKMLGRNPDWDRYKDRVLVYSTLRPLPVALEHFIEKFRREHGDRSVYVESGKRQWYMLVSPLQDVSGSEVGDLIIFRDVSAEAAAFRRLMTVAALVGSLILAGLIAFLFVTLRRTDSSIRAQQETLHNERKKLFVTLQSIGDGVITTDTEGRITFMNRVAERLTGWNQQEASGQALSEVFNIINEKTGEPAENPVKRVLDFGKIVDLANHTALIARDGTRRSITDSSAPILDLQGKIIGVVLVFSDVTGKRKREQEQLKIEKLESLGVLAGGIAHDFNNILTAILGNISLAYICIEKDHKAHRLLQEAEKASLRARDLTQQLLTFAKGGEPVRETTSIGQVIIDSANFVLRGSNVVGRYAIPEDLWLVDIDKGQVSQVIQNLAINARQAMPEGGEIKISCENVADITTEPGVNLTGRRYIKITIADNGCGIPEKYLDKIFDPYFSTKQEGSGLGLAITHSIIRKHEGHITVQSKPGEGTTFTIYLPASAEQVSNDSVEGAQKSEKPARSTILVMDDEEMIRDLAKKMLSIIGHEVLLAKDGEEAVAIFKERYHSDDPVDVIIMDLTIPGGMGGKEAIKEILKIDPEAKAIVSTGYANDPVMANYQQYGFKTGLGKPFNMAQLKETINSVLG